MKYADKRDIPYVVLAGEEEMSQQKFTLEAYEIWGTGYHRPQGTYRKTQIIILNWPQSMRPYLLFSSGNSRLHRMILNEIL